MIDFNLSKILKDDKSLQITGKLWKVQIKFKVFSLNILN